MVTEVNTRKIDADSHFFPTVDPEELARLLPDFAPEALDMIVRDAAVFTDPNARRGGFGATPAGQRTGGPKPQPSPFISTLLGICHRGCIDSLALAVYI